MNWIDPWGLAGRKFNGTGDGGASTAYADATAAANGFSNLSQEDADLASALGFGSFAGAGYGYYNPEVAESAGYVSFAAGGFAINLDILSRIEAALAHYYAGLAAKCKNK